jgi:hypothetical protein
VNDTAKTSSVGGGCEDSTLRGFAGASAVPTPLEHADDDAFSDPAIYIKWPNREAAGMRRWSEE